MASKSHLGLMGANDLKVSVETINGRIYEDCDVVTSQFNPQVFHFWDRNALVSIPYTNIAEIVHYRSEEEMPG